VPPAIARHERAGHNWNVGILEYWNNGFWDAGAMVYWENEPDKNIKNRRLPLKTSFHYSNIPLFQIYGKT
jgi:hypothetical protein